MQLSTTLPNAFPSNTVVNPAIECYAITIRNREALQDSKQEEAIQEFQAKQGMYDVLDDTNQDFVMQELDAIVQKNIAEMQQEHLELQPPRVDEVQSNDEAWRKIAALMIRDWKDALQGDKATSNTLNIEESQAAEFCSK
ncbi:hypothetical protein PIB30_084869 [Stylosanthes scabra]|uniref:Uncharacterized protein n=1 Tax=Stylosanthes scabra TaxID=79078 RepID=A0ABU6US83_9FABA|nr:hypothetical protein [Stylosanthes scabra]